MATQSPQPVHLIVFIHGFEGTANDFDNAEKILLLQAEILAKQGHDERLHVLKPRANSGFGGTYDGIEKGAIRIWREVMTVIHELSANLKAISLVGHSLGGLYARYLARLLHDCFIFEQYEPRLFVTLATPHLSIRRPQNSPINLAVHLVAKVVCKTTKELCLEDDPAHPTLFKMTDESFISVLRMFKRRIAYANVANDFQVHYATASISTTNPYTRTGIKTTRSQLYPDLIEWSLTSVHERKQHPQDLVDEFAKNDDRSRFLRAMFVRLNDLDWERYDAMFLTVFAHEQIINKRSFFAGKHVALHLCEHLLAKEASQQAVTEVSEMREPQIRSPASTSRLQLSQI